MKTLQCLFLSIVVIGLAATASGKPNRPYGMQARFFPMLGRLLTDDQRQSLLQIMDSERDQIQPLQERIRASREALLEQVVGGKFDEKLARQYAEQSAGAEVKLTVIFAKALSEMRPPLSAEQIAQLKNFQSDRFQGFRDEVEAPLPEVHLKLPTPLPHDTNDLPIVD